MASENKIILSDKKGIHALVMAAAHYGVQDVVICPGSRNAPLTISFHRSGLFRCHSIPDERVGGFYALGMALASGKPVALICTSGSASVNFGPALAEAFYLNTPVIAITADRPLSWTDQGNGQTIRQEGLFNNYIRSWFSLIAEPESRDDIWYNRRKLSETFNTALVSHPGPVQINVPMAEPLYGTVEYPSDELPRLFTKVEMANTIGSAALEAFTKDFQESPKVMVLVGQQKPDAGLQSQLLSFSEMANVVVLTETTSNVYGENIRSTIDRLVMPLKDENVLKALMPDILITTGGAVVSKKIKAILRTYQPRLHWHIDPTDQALDTYQSLTAEISMRPEAFFAALSGNISAASTSDYAARWKSLHDTCAKAHVSYLEHIPFSDFKVFDMVLPQLGNTTLHLANSSPVRYAQLFGSRPDVEYHSNRGASGIDGCTSTAAGWAMARPDENIMLITGDMAFIYDSNALWNKNFPQNLKIIVVNNQGGGIFRIIEGSEKVDELEAFFEAHHPAGISQIAEAFGLPFYSADNAESLRTSLHEFMNRDGAAVLEIRTPREENAGILKGYFRHIARVIKDQLNFSATAS